MRAQLVLLKEKMRQYGIDWYLVPTADYHNSEYVAPYFKCREYLSGFTGSNGTLLVGPDKVLLWTDGRYFIQADEQLRGTGIELMKMGQPGVPGIKHYLSSYMKPQETLGFDGRVCNAAYINDILAYTGIKNILYDIDLCDEIWKDRPQRPAETAYIIGTEFTGEAYLKKIARVRSAMEENGCQYLFLNKLDDIMWLFNMRGNDVDYNPVVLSYAFISQDDCYLFIQPEAVTDELALYLKINNIVQMKYDEVYSFLEENFREDKNFNTEDSVEPNLMADLNHVNYCAYGLLKGKTHVIDVVNPTTQLKTIKNATEIENMREFFLMDSVVVVKFMYWIECRKAALAASALGGSRYLKDENNYILNERSAAAYIDNLRSLIPGYKGLSFQTISAYGANAAMMHYEYGLDGGSLLQAKDFLLVDSGGQYIGATTDVTRTFVMGELSGEQKRDFTLVCKGMLNLMNTIFLKGCTGRNLDIIARAPLWKMGMDYKCGTGHGVGCFLNVHEGPQSIRWRYIEGGTETVLEPGMTITDEPGVYKANEYGIRTENTLLVTSLGESVDGEFLGFEPLTFVPIDIRGIDYQFLNEEDVEQLRSYQNRSIELISPYLEEDEREWIKSFAID